MGRGAGTDFPIQTLGASGHEGFTRARDIAAIHTAVVSHLVKTAGRLPRFDRAASELGSDADAEQALALQIETLDVYHRLLSRQPQLVSVKPANVEKINDFTNFANFKKVLPGIRGKLPETTIFFDCRYRGRVASIGVENPDGERSVVHLSGAFFWPGDGGEFRILPVGADFPAGEGLEPLLPIVRVVREPHNPCHAAEVQLASAPGATLGVPFDLGDDERSELTYLSLRLAQAASLGILPILGELKTQVDRFSLRSKTGRNEPCPCRSGKKFKRCCGA